MAEGGMNTCAGMAYKQVHDFYVFRELFMNKGKWKYAVRVKPTPDGPSRQPVDYFSGENILAFNSSHVRIPVLLYTMKRIHLPSFFKDQYRQQVGCHLLVLEDTLSTCELILRPFENESKPRYWLNRITGIHCVYPILQNELKGGKLCLGLHFKQTITGGSREFISKPVDNCDHRGVDEITEDYFDGFHNNPKDQMSIYSVLSPECCANYSIPDCKYHMLYVCAGARLVVHDFRTVESGTKALEVATGSLFQQGSFLIFEGHITIGFNAGYRRRNGVIKRTFFESLNILKTDDNPNIFPKELKTKLRLFPTKCTLFLGSTDSQCNSICWELYIYTDDNDARKMTSNLYVPECGRFVDIKSFAYGFEEIYYRHRYEQLYNAVLSPVTPKYGYHVPHLRLHNDILGLGQNPRQYFLRTSLYVNSDLPYIVNKNTPAYYTPYEERHFPLQVEKERVLERHSPARPLVIPLNPPILVDRETYQHISPLVAIDREPDSELYVINNMRYVLQFGEMPEYEWEYSMDLAELETMATQHGAQVWDGYTMKCGCDYRIYRRVERELPIIGVVEGFYFSKIQE